MEERRCWSEFQTAEPVPCFHFNNNAICLGLVLSSLYLSYSLYRHCLFLYFIFSQLTLIVWTGFLLLFLSLFAFTAALCLSFSAFFSLSSLLLSFLLSFFFYFLSFFAPFLLSIFLSSVSSVFSCHQPACCPAVPNFSLKYTTHA